MSGTEDDRLDGSSAGLAAAAATRAGRVAGLQQQCRAEGVDPESLVSVRDGIAAVLFTHDPAGAAQSGRADEYEPEAQTVALQLHRTTSEADLQHLVRTELTWWFDPETGRPDDRTRSMPSPPPSGSCVLGELAFPELVEA